MAYQSGKTYYLVPRFWVSSTTSRENILNKKTKPLALNTKGTGSHYNNRNCNLWTLDYSTDMQWKVEIPAEGGYARILCAGDTSYGIDYYHGEDDNGNCDIYKVAGNENDSKVNFITVNATENLYKIQCYKDNTGNNLYLTAMGNSDSKEVTNGTDVRWQALDSSKTTFQIWWLLPVEDVKEGSSGSGSGTIEVGKVPSDCNLNGQAYRSNINPFHYANCDGQCTWFAWGRVYEKLGKSILFRQNYGRNATRWPDLVTNCTQSSKPVTHSIIVWKGTDGGAYTSGHVAFIEKIENGLIYFSEANWDKNPENENPETDGKVKAMTERQILNRSPYNAVRCYLVP